MAPQYRLPFETPIYELEELLAKLEAANGQLGDSPEVPQIRRELVNLKRKIYSNLTPWQVVRVARHPERPQLLDYV